MEVEGAELPVERSQKSEKVFGQKDTTRSQSSVSHSYTSFDHSTISLTACVPDGDKTTPDDDAQASDEQYFRWQSLSQPASQSISEPLQK